MASQWKRLRERLAAIAAGEGRLDAGEVTRFAWLYRRHMNSESAAVLGERMAARRALAVR